MRTPADAADAVIHTLGIRSPEDLRQLDVIAWQRGAMVRFEPLRGAEARVTVLGGRSVITISSTITDPRRRRFSMAHELGHHELHRETAPRLTVCHADDLDHWRDAHQSGRTLEQEANEFAASLLLPTRLFGPACQTANPSLDLVAQLSNQFDVSLTATALRFAEFCPESIAVVFIQDHRVKWWRGSQEFRDSGLYVATKSRVSSHTRAGACYQSGLTRPSHGPVLAGEWIETRTLEDRAQIREFALPMATQRAVLSLLWVDRDILRDEDDDWIDD